MNKKELVESVSIERNLTKKEAELLVDTVFNTIRYLFLDLVLLKSMIVKLEKEFLLKLKKK